MSRELSRSFLSHAVRILQLILCSVVLAGCSKGTVGTVPLQPYRSNDVASASTAAQRFVHRAQERLSPHRTAQLLYSFEGGRDGAKPYAGLIALNGLLYGTTNVGGASDDGIVFEVDASGKERVLYSFEGGEDGAYPRAGLLVVDGTLYGTTSEGGDESSNPYGNGTVFEVSPSGTERVLYSFKGGRDGAEPFAGLIAMNGKLYGTTAYGGESQYGGSLGVKGLGTVFEVTTSGKERVLYRFKGGNDSAIPMADLIAVKGRRRSQRGRGVQSEYVRRGARTLPVQGWQRWRTRDGTLDRGRRQVLQHDVPGRDEQRGDRLRGRRLREASRII